MQPGDSCHLMPHTSHNVVGMWDPGRFWAVPCNALHIQMRI